MEDNDYLWMDRGPFFNLARTLHDGGSLRDTHHMSIRKQLTMFLHILGHNAKNKVVNLHFICLRETISKYFNVVLSAIFRLRLLLMKQAEDDMAEEILNRTTWSPYFQVGYILIYSNSYNIK